MSQKSTRICSFFLVGGLLLSSFSPVAYALNTEPVHYIAILNEKERAAQAAQFVTYMKPKIKYSSSGVYNGRQGKWIASLDVYSAYDEGIVARQMLQQATIQYNARILPADTASASISINGNDFTQKYSKNMVSFNFKPVDLPTSTLSQKLKIKVSVDANGETINIPISQNYFDSSDAMSDEKVLETIAFAYCDYARKNDIAAPADVVMRLKSYENNTTAGDRSYSWEVYFIEKSTLPSPAVLVRYDCVTGSRIVSEREVKDYFK